MKLRKLTGRIVAAAALACLVAAPVSAQIKYGPWVKQGNTCRPLEVQNTFGQRIRSPQVPGAAPAQTCDYCRQVEDCSRIRDKVMHPKQCITQKKQCKPGFLSGPPRD